jgi:hypothetical protein
LPPPARGDGSGEGAEELVGKMDEKKVETWERYGAVEAYTPSNHEALPSPTMAEAAGAGGEDSAMYAVNAAKATAKAYTTSLALRRERPAPVPTSVHAMAARPLCFHMPFIPPARAAAALAAAAAAPGQSSAAVDLGKWCRRRSESDRGDGE